MLCKFLNAMPCKLVDTYKTCSRCPVQYAWKAGFRRATRVLMDNDLIDPEPAEVNDIAKETKEIEEGTEGDET